MYRYALIALKSLLKNSMVLCIMVLFLLASSCQQRVCPANERSQFHKQRARHAMMNHYRNHGGQGHKHKETKKREPQEGLFRTKLNKKQFKQQTKSK